MPKIRQNTVADISVDIVTSDNKNYVTIHQDGKTIFLEHSMIDFLMIAINDLKTP